MHTTKGATSYDETPYKQYESVIRSSSLDVPIQLGLSS
jgi:hypothetical protein